LLFCCFSRAGYVALSLSLSFCLALCLSRFLARANHLPLRLGRARDPALACNGPTANHGTCLWCSGQVGTIPVTDWRGYRFCHGPPPCTGSGDGQQCLRRARFPGAPPRFPIHCYYCCREASFFLCERNLVFQKGVTQQCLLLLVPPRAMASPPLTKVSSELSCRFWIEADSVFLVKMGAMMGTCMTILSISRGDTID